MEAPLPSPRPLALADLDEVTRVDAVETGRAKRAYWEAVFRAFVGADGPTRTFGFGVDAEGGGLGGFVLGEVRAFEFGSEPCGWVFAIGIDHACRRRGIASRLLEAACVHFVELGVTRVRTMVRRNDVPVLSFFRSCGFVGGPYVQLECDLGGGE